MAEQTYGDWRSHQPLVIRLIKRLRRTAPESPRHWAANMTPEQAWAEVEFRAVVDNVEAWAAARGVPADRAREAWHEYMLQLHREVEIKLLNDGVYPAGAQIQA